MRRKKHYLANTHYWMMHRCYKKSSKAYKYYGGRGIDVYKPWHDVDVFCKELIELIGDKPFDHTLDRIDNDKGYYPGNVKWSNPQDQARNSRINKNNLPLGAPWESKKALRCAASPERKNNLKIEYDGEYFTVAELARACKAKYSVMYHRLIVKKWPVRKAILRAETERFEREFFKKK